MSAFRNSSNPSSQQFACEEKDSTVVHQRNSQHDKMNQFNRIMQTSLEPVEDAEERNSNSQYDSGKKLRPAHNYSNSESNSVASKDFFRKPGDAD
mmetsp:Transcript_34577/g.40030  ORF Transcript_34577/g.40030 Transcript_34577/m.40030 type:complete len:95 (-) Transcript_34577:19-303(-)